MTNYICLPERKRRRNYRNYMFNYTTLNYLSIEFLSVLSVSKEHLYENIKDMCGHCPIKIKGTCCRLWLELVCIHTEHIRQKYRPDRSTNSGAFYGVKMHLSPGTSPANWPKSLSVLLKSLWIWCITLHVIDWPILWLWNSIRIHALIECLTLQPEENGQEFSPKQNFQMEKENILGKRAVQSKILNDLTWCP